MFRLARENERYIGFEASVGGGIPIIQTLRNSLVGNRIRSIEGIINGTTNYILTRMEEQDLDFETALVQAQDLGFAEADPTLDINGGDAASKIAILSAISFHQNITFDDVHVEGIENVKLSHVHDAQELGYSIKLIAMSRIDQNGEVEVRVHPALVSPKNPLSSIRNEYNAILVNSDYLGESMYYGKGAGPFPTASAVVSDIVEIGGKTIKKKEYNAYFFSLSEEKNTKPFSKIISRYYIRIMIKDVPGILAKIATVMGKHDISIASLNQKRSLEEFVPVIFTTQHATEKQFSEALKEIKNFDFVDNIVYYRIID
jgi:homoserine dehydrogenase